MVVILIIILIGLKAGKNSPIVIPTILYDTTTLIPPTYFEKAPNPKKTIILKDPRIVLRNLTLLYLNYLQQREVENLYLLLDDISKEKYTRDAINQFLNNPDLKIYDAKIAEELTLAIYSANDNKLQNVNSGQDKIEITDDETLFAELPINLQVFRNNNRKSFPILLTAKYSFGKWQFDFPFPSDKNFLK